jgi:hypothetical protein
LTRDPADAAWQSDFLLVRHFRRHGGRLNCTTIDQYNESARAIIDVGVHFEHRDPGNGEWRLGFTVVGETEHHYQMEARPPA